jgi:hypothetical protein
LDDSTTPLASVSSTPYLKPKTVYNKSKKRAKIEGSDDEDKGTLAPVAKKVDLRHAISGLSAEMARGRKAREEYKSAQEKAIQLLESYRERLDTMAFIKGCTFFEDKAKARIFISISNIKRRDRWLEVNLYIELRPVE